MPGCTPHGRLSTVGNVADPSSATEARGTAIVGQLRNGDDETEADSSQTFEQVVLAGTG